MKKKGFTLIELAIAIVLIGILIIGVLGARQLMKQSTIQKMGKSFEQYERIASTFLLQYKGLPGDINGDSLWNCSNVSSGTCTPPSATLYNGLLDNDNKGLYFWIHLRKAKFLEGAYDLGSTSFLPSSDLGGYISVERYGIYALPSTTNYLSIGSLRTSGLTNANNFGAISVLDAYYLDQKFDDGHPGKGKIITVRGNNFGSIPTSCVNRIYTYNTNDDVSYLFDDKGNTCRIWWKLEVK